MMSKEVTTGPETVQEEHRCPECDNQSWYMGYDETGEFVNECAECGYVFLP